MQFKTKIKSKIKTLYFQFKVKSKIFLIKLIEFSNFIIVKIVTIKNSITNVSYKIFKKTRNFTTYVSVFLVISSLVLNSDFSMKDSGLNKVSPGNNVSIQRSASNDQIFRGRLFGEKKTIVKTDFPLIIAVGTPDSSGEVFRGGTLPDDTNPSNSKKDSEQESSKKDKKNNENSQASKKSEKNSRSSWIPGVKGFTIWPNILNRPRSKPVPQNPGSVNSDQNQRSQYSFLELGKKKFSNEEVISTLNMAAEDGKIEVICDIEIPALMRYARDTFMDPKIKKDLVHLLEQYRSGNLQPGKGNKAIKGTGLVELRGDSGARCYIEVKKDNICLKGISDKKNQDQVLDQIHTNYAKK